MRILSFDPGHQTGVAFINDGGDVVFSTVIRTAGLTDRYFQGLMATTAVDVVLIEELPQNQRDSESASNYELIKRWFQMAGVRVETASPGQWKGMSRLQHPLSPQHQKDAAEMGHWYWRREKGKLINVLT